MATTQIKDGFNGGSDNQLRVNDDGSINTTGSGGNASVGSNTANAPTSATQIGGVNPEGKLTQISVDDNGFVNVNGISTIAGPVTTEQAGLSTFQTSQYSIGLTAIQLAPTALPNRSSLSITISADPNVAIYVGNSNLVTILTGYPLYDGSTLQLDLTPTGAIWAISATAGQIAAVLEIA